LFGEPVEIGRQHFRRWSVKDMPGNDNDAVTEEISRYAQLSVTCEWRMMFRQAG
jgi:hypothetical protein